MEEIRRTKIKEAMKETLNVYEKLDLNMTEIEIVSRSQNVAAKVAIAKKQLETEAEERLEKQQTPMKTKIIKWMPAICSTLAIIGEKGIRRATVIKDCAYTITTRQDRTPAQVIDRGDGRYRYLTERECWRLMGYTDEDFEDKP